MRAAIVATLVLASLAGAVAQADVLELQAVPGGHARLLQQAAAAPPGGYYGSAAGGRSLLQAPGGYYGGSGAAGATPRRLAESDAPLEPRDPLIEYAEQKQAAADARLEAEQAAAGGVSAATLAALKQQRSPAGASSKSLPPGQCYCRHDTDFDVWALAEEPCKRALYARCQTEPALNCSWLDKFYAPSKGPGHVLPHEADINAFLYEDCSPQPPCACAGLKFDGSDAVPGAVACCRDLRVACRTPFSGLDCRKVDSFCSDDKPAPVLAAWSRHTLHHAQCSAYRGVPYQFVSLREMLAAPAAAQSQAQRAAGQPAAQQPAGEAALLTAALASMQQQEAAAAAAAGHSDAPARRLLVALAAVTVGALCVAVVAVAFALRREEEARPQFILPHSSAGSMLTPPPAAATTVLLYGGKRGVASVGSVHEPLLHDGSYSRPASAGH